MGPGSLTPPALCPAWSKLLPKPTQLVYILGCSFPAVSSRPLRLPHSHRLPPTLGWGHQSGSTKKKQATAEPAPPFQPCGSPQMRRSGATALETSEEWGR